MAYSTQADIEIAAGGAERLAELTDLDYSGVGAPVFDPLVLAAAIADADAMIDTYIGKNNAVPLTAPIPRTVARISADEAIYLLRMRRSMVGEFEETRHENNLRWLEGAAKGFLVLGVEPSPAKSSIVSPGVVEVADDAREDTRAALKGLW